MKNFVYILLIVIFSASCKSENDKTIYFVRHAEKDNLYPKDPALTMDGVMRSVDLVAFFKNIAVDTILSSDTKRTIETAQPLSEKQVCRHWNV